MKFTFVGRRDGWLIRLFRVVWTTGQVGDGKGYSTKFSLGLYPRLIGFKKEFNSFFVYVLGLRFHFDRSYGGIHT